MELPRCPRTLLLGTHPIPLTPGSRLVLSLPLCRYSTREKRPRLQETTEWRWVFLLLNASDGHVQNRRFMRMCGRRGRMTPCKSAAPCDGPPARASWSCKLHRSAGVGAPGVGCGSRGETATPAVWNWVDGGATLGMGSRGGRLRCCVQACVCVSAVATEGPAGSWCSTRTASTKEVIQCSAGECIEARSCHAHAGGARCTR